jgi:hypothetical protein
MMNRFMELFRCNAEKNRRDTAAPDFEALRRANYERDDAERAKGVDFARLARRRVRPAGRRGPIGAVPAEPERR